MMMIPVKCLENNKKIKLTKRKKKKEWEHMKLIN